MSILGRQIGQVSALVACCLALSLTQGCVRQEPLHSSDVLTVTQQQGLPFHPDHLPSDDGSRPAVPPDSKTATAFPFRSLQRPLILPSGTLLTVQLKDSLSAATVRAGDTFSASMAAPFTIGGHILVDRGTAVTGRVESAQSVGPRAGAIPIPGYFQLVLTAMTVDGRQVSLQTSSLFARGTLPLSDGRGDVLVEKGRRLTFRLAAPALLNDRDSMADRQYLTPRSE